MINLPKPIKKALYMIENAGYQGYIVGGCVRDALMGIEPHDYDITTSALPNEVKTVFEEYKVIETGIKHGTVTVLVDGYPLEVTTFRVEGEYLDGRHPSSVSFTRNLEEDVARRDFTINAMACDVRGEVFDYFGGRDDIEAGVIRAVGDAKARFEEDALRIMRALRFASVTGFEIEEGTAIAARDCKEMLSKISAERIREELFKLLLGKNVKKIILEFWDVLAVVIPEISHMKGFEQKSKWHIYDVLEHTAVTVENAPGEVALKVAALLHDIGKPKCFSIDDSGEGHFLGHAHVSVDMAKDIMGRLKFDNETRERVLRAIKYHDVQIQPVSRQVKRALNKYTVQGFFDLVELKRADNLAQNPSLSMRQEYLDELLQLAEEIIEEEQCFSLKDLAVNGSDLIAMGIKPGREIGEMLEILLEAVIEEKLPNSKAELLEFAQKIKK